MRVQRVSDNEAFVRYRSTCVPSPPSGA